MAGPGSILTRVIAAAAQRLAEHPSIPGEARAAFQAHAESLMHAQWSAMFGGERVWVRIYAPRVDEHSRNARRARILLALAEQHDPAAIAKRERVSVRWVQRLRKKANSGTP